MSRPLFRSAFTAGYLTPSDVLAFHRSTFGNARMDATDDPPERPDGVSEEEWEALGDPGKRAIVRERARASKAESDLAAARASAPKPTPPSPPAKTDPPATGPGDVDIAAVVQQAVAAAIKPFQDREDEREAEQSAQKIADALTSAAKTRLYDPSDAVANIDLTTLTDGNGKPDAAKIAAALDDLVKRKPHLVDSRRFPATTAFMGGGPANGTLTADDKVKAALAKMQSATGVKLTADA